MPILSETDREPIRPADNRYSILVVDDRATDRMMVRTVLNNSDYRILEAKEGEEALQLINEQDINVVLLDIAMPGMNGFEVCQRIRQIEKMRLLPVIMLVPEEDAASMITGIHSGATDYLIKPFRPSELMARLAIAVERSRLNRELDITRCTAKSIHQSNSSFLATMSQEIQTPMNVIIGLSHLCVHNPLDKKAQGNYLEKINHSAKSLLSIINDMLVFLRIEAGKFELSEEDFDLRGCLAQADSLVGYLARNKGLSFKSDISKEVPNILHGDAVCLGQVLINLARNAVKFTDKGSVTIHVAASSINPDSVELHFTVRDTGIGLNPMQIDRFFESYSQADQFTYPKDGGSGIGLVISRELVEMMQGRIWIESILGHGSSYHFTACFGPGQQTEESVASMVEELEAAKARIKGTHILIAEDNPFNQLIIQDLLGVAGAVAVIASNGQEACERLTVENFDLILMDIQMPVMDGFEATRRIREKTENAKLRIVAMAGNVTPEDRKQYLIAGMDDFIIKPVDSNQMYMILAKWLPHQREIPCHESRRSEEVNKLMPVDLSVLHQMFHNNAALVRKFGLKFIEVANDTLAEMNIAQAEKDLPALGRLGHKLKSSARTIGASSFADLCEKLEKANQNNNWSNAESLLEQIPVLLTQITHQLEQEFRAMDK